MNFDVYCNTSREIKVDENEVTEKSTRKNFKNITLEETKKVINEFLSDIPDDTNSIWLSVEKTYEERLDDALGKI